MQKTARIKADSPYLDVKQVVLMEKSIEYNLLLQKKLLVLEQHQLFYVMLILLGWTPQEIAEHREISYEAVWRSLKKAKYKMMEAN